MTDNVCINHIRTGPKLRRTAQKGLHSGVARSRPKHPHGTPRGRARGDEPNRARREPERAESAQQGSLQREAKQTNRQDAAHRSQMGPRPDSTNLRRAPAMEPGSFMQWVTVIGSSGGHPSRGDANRSQATPKGPRGAPTPREPPLGTPGGPLGVQGAPGMVSGRA